MSKRNLKAICEAARAKASDQTSDTKSDDNSFVRFATVEDMMAAVFGDTETGK